MGRAEFLLQTLDRLRFNTEDIQGGTTLAQNLQGFVNSLTCGAGFDIEAHSHNTMTVAHGRRVRCQRFDERLSIGLTEIVATLSLNMHAPLSHHYFLLVVATAIQNPGDA